MKKILLFLTAAMALSWWVGPAGIRAGAPAPAYSYNILSLGGDSDESYIGMFPGDDMLPYTDDDFEIETDCGNFAGTWGFAHMDHNADGVIDENEPILHTVRANDDDSTLFSVSSRPEYGVIYEGEDWTGFWASGNGPNRCNLAEATGYDFEINDHNGWTDESNAYVYNNLGNNQHGLGYARYRVDYRTSPQEGQDFAYDEIEGWKKSFVFRNNTDDPSTEFVENSSCNRWFRPRDELDIRGYLIPVDDLENLANGSLPTLFGWESVDLAAYFRDTIFPLVTDHEDLGIWSELIGFGFPPDFLLPITHVYLMQMMTNVDVDNGEDTCGDDLAQVEAHAAYWGFPEDGSGMFRVSMIMGFNSRLVPRIGDALGSTLHDFSTEPSDGAERNLWLQDHFWRDNGADLGRYDFIPAVDPEGVETPPWQILDDPGLGGYDLTQDQVLVSNEGGAVSAPLPRSLSVAEAPVVIVADLGVEVDLLEEDAVMQIIARSGDDVVAYAELSEAATTVNIGGDYDPATGTVSNPDASGGDGFTEFGPVSILDISSQFTRLILTINPGGASLLDVLDGEYETSNFAGLEELDGESSEVAGATSFGDGITHVTISGPKGTVISTLLVFASPGVGPFIRGDCNQDGSTDISDGVTALAFLFLGEDAPGCLASCFANGQGTLDLSSAVFLFNFLFTGGFPIPPPVGTPAYSQNAADGAVGCDDYSL